MVTMNIDGFPPFELSEDDLKEAAQNMEKIGSVDDMLCAGAGALAALAVIPKVFDITPKKEVDV